jgi:hypothetical protein
MQSRKFNAKKQRIVKTVATAPNKSKRKEKGFFFSFRFKTTSHSSPHIGRMGDSAMRPARMLIGVCCDANYHPYHAKKNRTDLDVPRSHSAPLMRPM